MVLTVDLTDMIIEEYPSHIAIPLPKGYLYDANKICLSNKQPTQPVVAATWPDSSIKWIHLYTLLNAHTQYNIEILDESISFIGLQIIEQEDKWIIDDKYYLTKNGVLSIIDICGEAKSLLIDERFITYTFEGTVNLIVNGPVCAIFKLDGWLQSSEKRVEPFCKQTTYITFYHNSTYIKFSHAITFAANMNDHSIYMLGYKFTDCINATLTSLDEKQKFPNYIDHETTTFYQWPGINDVLPYLDTELQYIYRFSYLNEGPILTTRMPNNYLKAWANNPDTTECKAEYARAANMQGLSLHNDFCLIFDSNEDKITAFQTNPIGIVRNTETEVFGAVSKTELANNGFSTLDRLVRETIRACERSAERFSDYGLFIFGNQHHDEFVNELRPSLHRCWSNNHYQQCSIWWLHSFLSANHEILRWARRATDYYASIGMIRYDQMRGYYDGNGNLISNKPETKFHLPGAFYHCKGVLPWGGRGYGMDSDDVDAWHIGHWPDPSSLLYSWLIDANYWHKDGYDLWDQSVRSLLYTYGRNRDVNTTLVHTLTLYEYTHDQSLLTNIEGMINGLISYPLKDQAPGPFWEPTWLARYYEYRKDNTAFNEFVVTSADTCRLNIELCWGLALNITAYEITGDIKYLTKFIPCLQRVLRIPAIFSGTDPWNMFNFKPGPNTAGDSHFCYQWPRMSHALQKAEILTWDRKWIEPGMYAGGIARFDYQPDIDNRGTQIYVDVTDTKDFKITIDLATISSGNCQAASLQVKDPNGVIVLFIPRLNITNNTRNRIERESTYQIDREEYTITNPIIGIYKISLTANQLGCFAKLTEYSEIQVLQSKNQSGTTEPQNYCCKLSQLNLIRNTEKPIEISINCFGKKSPVVFNNNKGYKPPNNIIINDLARMDLHCEGDAYIEFSISCEDKYPLLMGISNEELSTFKPRFQAFITEGDLNYASKL